MDEGFQVSLITTSQEHRAGLSPIIMLFSPALKSSAIL